MFIVEDHPVFREGLVQVIGREPDLEVCGQAGDGETGLKKILSLKPDVVLIDISLPGMNGLALIKEIRERNKQVKLLVVSMHDEALYANRVLRAGGNGYIMKQEDPEEVVHAIRDVLAGHIYVSEEVFSPRRKTGQSPSLSGGEVTLDALSDKQLELLELVGMGNDNAAIAARLQLRPEKVTAELEEIQRKLKLGSQTEMIRFAVCWVEAGQN